MLVSGGITRSYCPRQLWSCQAYVATVEPHHDARHPRLWEAPGHVLGRFPAPPILDRALVLATDSGEPAERVERLNSLLTEMFASGAPALPGAQSTAICQYLDLPGYPEWQALYEGDRLALVLSKGLAIGAA
jgi:hypothetical protein